MFVELKGVIGRITPALLDHDQALVTQAVGFFAVLQRRLANDVLLDALIALVKFSQARAVLAERMQRPVKSGTVSAAPSVAGPEPAADGLEDAGKPAETAAPHEDMRIDEGDEPITLEDYVLLDEELGIELRVRPRPVLLSVEGLTRSLSSVLRSPFTNGGSDSEADVPSADEIQMAAIEPAGSTLTKTAEENPFL